MSEWKKCGTCKKSIEYGAVYYLCSQNNCKSPKLGLRFCSSLCWDAHKNMVRHRDAWAEEETAPVS